MGNTEELLDCVVYVIADYIRQSRDNLVYRNDFFLKVGDDDNSLIMHIWKHKQRMDACTTKTMLNMLAKD